MRSAHAYRSTVLATLSLFAASVLSPVHAAGLAELYRAVNPAVLVLHTNETVVSRHKAHEVTSESGIGSGVLISKDGLVLTAAHVVQTADEVLVEFKDGEKVLGTVVSSEPAADVALLKLKRVPHGTKPVKLADSDAVSIGDNVFVIGAPYGLAHSLTAGYISGRLQPRRMMGGFSMGEFFQTDAAINQGNSGGPLFNMRGEVIGIVSHILSQSGGFEGLGFAVTSNAARQLLLEERPMWSGIEGYVIGDELAAALNVTQKHGLLVQKVARGSPAADAGIRGGTLAVSIGDEELLLGGDIILAVAGVTISDEKSYRKIRERVRTIASGERIDITVLRAGKTVELSTTRRD